LIKYDNISRPLGLRGDYYDDEVPDTLDLAQRAECGISHLTGIIDEHLGHEMYFHGKFDQSSPPVLSTHVTSLGACQSKGLEALAFLRVMTGSTLNLNTEQAMVEMMAGMLGDDGLHWVDGDLSVKPWLRISEPFAMVHGQGRMARAMVAWYQYTGDSAWKERIDALVHGLDRMVVRKDDYAYFPTLGLYDDEYLRSCFTEHGWKDTAEPRDEKGGEEGSLFNHQGHMPGVLATWYGMTGNEEALELSGKLVRFLTKPQFWADVETGEYPLTIGAEHAHWQGHLHGHANTLRAVLEYAIVTNDSRLKAFVRDGYEWSRQILLPRIGYFDYQGCATARMIGLAIKLSDAGVGDYWEDVDQYIRNHGVEMQITPDDADYLASLAEGKPNPPDDPGVNADDAIKRSIGGFAMWSSKSRVGLCCGTHGNMGLFYAWEGALRYLDGTARVNLLLNRASQWLDIHSYLPYESKVVIRNKTARELFVRIPLWADRGEVTCLNNGLNTQTAWFGNYLRINDLRPGDEVTIEFPMVETTERWTVHQVQWPGNRIGEQVTHTCHFRGNTLIEMTPGLSSDSPLYTGRKTQFSKDETPMKTVTRYASPVSLRW